ncbi:MAG TPA: YlxR family protein [Chloroflexi bacterium]|nr:YlxR family protein [Chloroflexota bacterium]
MKKKRLRHIPLRTCIACRTQRPKRELLRVVCSATGEVVVDTTGKLNGRGAYLCAQRGCWEQALARGGLARALRGALTAAQVAGLRSYAASLPERQDAAEVLPPESGDLVEEV